MQKEVNEYKVICYVDKTGLTTLRCPQCGTAKTIDTTKKDYAFKTFRAKCKCGSRITGRFEFRRYYRKKVRLSGSYRHRNSGIRGKIIVEDISLMGIGFTCLRKHHFQKGDQLDITFTLDNPQKSTVTLWVIVHHIRDRFVGVQRCDSQLDQPDLGFYLR